MGGTNTFPMRVPTSQNQRVVVCRCRPGKLSAVSTVPRARPRQLRSVGDQASQTYGSDEVFAVEWQLADQLSDVS